MAVRELSHRGGPSQPEETELALRQALTQHSSCLKAPGPADGLLGRARVPCPAALPKAPQGPGLQRSAASAFRPAIGPVFPSRPRAFIPTGVQREALGAGWPSPSSAARSSTAQATFGLSDPRSRLLGRRSSVSDAPGMCGGPSTQQGRRSRHGHLSQEDRAWRRGPFLLWRPLEFQSGRSSPQMSQ